jgi:hypothetical protein
MSVRPGERKETLDERNMSCFWGVSVCGVSSLGREEERDRGG